MAANSGVAPIDSDTDDRKQGAEENLAVARSARGTTHEEPEPRRERETFVCAWQLRRAREARPSIKNEPDSSAAGASSIEKACHKNQQYGSGDLERHRS